MLDGRVSGTIIAEPDKARFLEVVLVEVGRDARYRTTANAYGAFEFLGVPPGNYRLLFEPRVLLPPTRLCPHIVPTYYPGTANEDEAVPITVGVATHHDGLNFAPVCIAY